MDIYALQTNIRKLPIFNIDKLDILSIRPFNALVAQLVEQLICNQ